MPDHLTPDVERELAALDDALAGRPVAPDLAELGELARALRAERPAISAGFAAGLDANVERGFPDGSPRRASAWRRWSGWAGWAGWMAPALGVTATALLIAVVIIATPGGGDDQRFTGASGGTASSAESTDGAASGSERSASAAEAQDDSASLAEPLPPGSVAPAPAQGSPGSDGRDRREVERSASLTLAARSRDIDAISARVQEVTRRQGGFVVSSTVSAFTGGGGGSFELRIPTRNLDAAMAALSRLGRVRERAQHSEDITAQAVSARSRLIDAKTERGSLLEQLGAAVTVQETEEIRERLEIVSREIERARAGLRRVRNRAAFATVAVELVADDSAAPARDDDGAWTPGDAARDALRVLEVIAGVALIALAIGLPLALLALSAGLAARWARRRRREHALDAV